jgi:hypothetical protein
MRKTAQITVADEGRDKGKVFLITEMPSAQGEAWATRALLALMANNTNVPENFVELGMAGLAELGLRALSSLRWEVLSPLLDEMMGCIQTIPDPKKTHVIRPLIDDDIEEISTRLKLRMEWWELHMGFLAAVAPSISLANQAKEMDQRVRRVTGTSRK